MSSRKTSPIHKRPVRAKGLISLLRKEQNPLKMKMLLLGYVTDRLEKTSQSIFLVGGQAVEIYTGGQFLTGDIDITTTDRPGTERILGSVGFKEIGMIWLNEQLGVAVHIVDMLPHYLEKTRTIKTGPYNVRVIGIEDLIVDRLSAAKFWNSSGDMEKAMVLITNFRKQIDENYLRKAAEKSNVEDILAKARIPVTIKPRKPVKGKYKDPMSVLIGKKPYHRHVPIKELEEKTESR
ncbi:MAG TPA: UbiD family decarboxylase [Candidatus Bathyarchaeia archaeon]|nr:UbiD family decarboxylase [Candidatus Bathyarchaeia archaeon]